MLEGNKFFPGNRDAHLKDGAQHHHVGGLAAGAVHRRHVDAEVVDDGLAVVRNAAVVGYCCFTHDQNVQQKSETPVHYLFLRS